MYDEKKIKNYYSFSPYAPRTGASGAASGSRRENIDSNRPPQLEPNYHRHPNSRQNAADRALRCRRKSKSARETQEEIIRGFDESSDGECGPNSRYINCKTECSNEPCPTNDSRRAVTCVTPEPCKPGCVCNLNHKRNNTDGQCIVASDCPPANCTRSNEVWDSCPSACLAEDCSDVDNQPVTCNTLVLNCEPRCVCKKGFYRNKHGICVKPKHCGAEQPASVCPENEVFVECQRAHCGPKSCGDLGYPIPCNGATAACHAGCVCADGYVRNDKNVCILKTDCPSCGGDPNAKSGCGNHCGNSCSDYQEVNKTCFSGCRYNACDCKDSYVYNERSSKCVEPETCCAMSTLNILRWEKPLNSRHRHRYSSTKARIKKFVPVVVCVILGVAKKGFLEIRFLRGKGSCRLRNLRRCQQLDG
ncbi:hypothetical protein EVAR_95253_1 [Eumeta japonica]|uniref:TIL domain-containing protein n=1 Tax=Eumeta variegata TaxID=151549 RepID=A0A4C1ULA0_EUMVA|nr:hypothetical protein EVAR_95253_1 [Eumeta japonica]